MDIKLPKLGEGSDSGSVVSILVKVGDLVKKGQALMELENEKAVAPIPSSAAGRVTQIFVSEGQKIAVGQRILALGEAGEDASLKGTPDVTSAAPIISAKPPQTQSKAAKQAPKPEEPAAPVEEEAPEPEPLTDEPASSDTEASSEEPPKAPPAKLGTPPPASPSLRKMARELGIDLTRVKGSEAGGRIVMRDLRAYIQRLQQISSAAKPASAKPVVTQRAPVSEPVDFSQWGPISRKPMSSLRNIISRRMHESWTAIPHVTQFDEADITGLLELRKKYSAAYEAKGARLTITPFTLKAAVVALIQSPIFNASLDELTNEIIFKEYFHIGLAVDTDAGLIVPVIRDVDKKSIFELAKELHDLAERTRSRKVSLEDLKGGTFTISNQGGIGGAHFTPIINKPEAAILGLGRSVMKPVFRNNQIEPRTMMPVCVSYDHRLIDGGKAARFIVQIVQALENFNEDEVKTG